MMCTLSKVGRSSTRRRFLGAGVVAVALLTGCGDDDAADSSATSATSESAEASSVSTEATATSESTEPTEATASSDESASSDTSLASSTEPEAGGITDQMIADANAEGSLFVYSVITPEDAESVTAAFNSVYPDIEVTFDRRPTPALEAVIEAEAGGASPIGDLYLTTSKGWLEAHPDLLTPLATASLGDPIWTPFVGVEGRAVEFVFMPVAVGWNNGTLPDGVASLEAIATRPDGQVVGVPDPAVSDAGRAFMMSATERLGEEWLCGAVQGANIYESTAPLAQALAAGEVDIAFPMLSNAMAALTGQGAPVDSVLVEPHVAIRVSATVLASSPHPNAAQLFADFLLTPAGQEALSAAKASPLPDVPGAIGQVAPEDESVDLLGVSTEEQDAFLATFQGCVTG